MKPLDLKEFAENLLLGQHREFAIEILDNLDFVENSQHDQICMDISHHSEKEFKGHDPISQIDRIGDRLNLLDEIKDTLNKHGFDADPDDEVRNLIEVRCQVELMLQDAGLWTDGELADNIALLIERIPQYDL